MIPHVTRSSDRMPKGIGNAYAFQVFNSISYSLVIGLPILLYLKALGASATILGVATALPPLLNLLQIPAARYVELVGYRRFVLRGWSLRSGFILLIALVALLPSQFDNNTRISLTLFLLFSYNLVRGISVCGFLPWISQLVPEKVRGRYISLDNIFGFSAISVTALACGVYLESYQEDGGGFFAVFLVSFLAATASLHFLRRIPDVPVPEDAARRSAEPVPWRSMLRHRPFTRVLWFNILVVGAMAGSGVLIIPFLRDVHEVDDSLFLYLQAAWGVVFILTTLVVGRLADRAGSKPLLMIGTVLMTFHFAGWGAVGGGVLPFTPGVIAFQQISWGVAFAFFQVANMRLVMQVVPAMGRSHFFAIYSVGVSLSAGILPVLWGGAVDMIGNWSWQTGFWQWKSFSILYVLVVLVCLSSLIVLRRVEEPDATHTDVLLRELLVHTPARALTRLFNRRPIP